MRSHDKIAVRLAQIIVKLNGGARLSIDELVEEFNVNKRTILRDFERLSILSAVNTEFLKRIEKNDTNWF